MISPAALRFSVLLSLPSIAVAVALGQEPASIGQPASVTSYGNLPLLFEANQGQTDPSVQFLSHGQGYTLYLRKGEAVLALHSAAQKNNPDADSLSRIINATHETSVVQVQLVGSNPRAEVIHEDPQITRTNYFLGKDPNQWHTGIPNYSRIRYRSIYNGIDQVYYGNQRQLEHDFVIAPNADPDKIVLALEGAKNLRIDASTGDLIVDTGHGDLRLHKPIAYQQEPNHPRSEIPSSYKLLAGNRIAFTLGSYDRSSTLVIDPVLTYSTYLGGSGNNGNGDQGNGIAVDPSGNAYIVGTAYSTNFPVTAGAYQTQDNAASGNSTVFVSELNAAGTALIYSTYLGGSGGDFGYGIALDVANNAYITGATYSTDFPVTCNAYQVANPSTTSGAPTSFVARLALDGNTLLYSTYLGGTGNQSSPALGDVAQAIAVDTAGDAFITGYTYSSDFPVSAAAFQAAYAGSATTSNAFATKLNPGGTALLYSTYLGGSGTPANNLYVSPAGDYGNAIAIDSSGDAYIAGTTSSYNFPLTNTAFQTTLAGPSNGFVTKLNPAGSAEVYSTYLGGSGQQYDISDDFNPPPATGDTASAIAVDASGNAYVAGTTTSANFPVTAGVLEGATSFDSSSGFVTKLNTDGSTLVYSTYLEGVGTTISGLAVDGSGSAFVTGAVPAVSIGVTDGFQTTADALPAPSSTANSAFLVKLDPSATVLNYATLLGGSSNDGANALALDGMGNVYLTGFATSTDFPVTTGAFQSKFGQPSATPIPTTMSLVSQEFNCDVREPGFEVVANFTISPNSDGPAPTGTVHFWGDFEVDDNQTVFPGGGGTAIVHVVGVSSSALQQSAEWEADYSGDSIYLPSSISGTATGPGNCDSQPFARRGAEAKTPISRPQPHSQAGQRKAAHVSSVVSADAPVRGTDAVGNSNAFVSKFALAGESNQTTYPASPAQIATTLTAGPSSISLTFCDPNDYSANAFNFTASAILNTASPGPPPTGTIIFTDSFNYNFPYPYQIQFVGYWDSVPLGFSLFDGESMDGPIGPFSVNWTATYYGDAVYGGSTISGSVSSPGCPASSGSVRKSASGDKIPRIEVHSSKGQIIGGTSLRTLGAASANATLPGTALEVAGSHAAKFTPTALLHQNGQTPDARRVSSQETLACVAPPQTATPVLPAYGGITFSSPLQVTITDGTPGAIIYYTTDGTTPTASSTVYAGVITVSGTETIQAIAAAFGYSTSAVASLTLTVILPTVSTPAFSPATGTYSSAQSVTIFDNTPGATIYYTTNGSMPTISSTLYSGPITVSSTETIQAIAIDSDYSNSAVASATYTISPPAATPTFSPAAGTYATAQSVTIADTTPGAAIHYTTDGTTPTASSAVYAAAIPVSSTETIQAIAIATGCTDSPVASAIYTINLPPAATPTFLPAAGTYTSAQSVILADTTTGAVIHYTTDGTTPTASSAVYATAIPVSSTETIQAIAIASGYTNSAVASATYTITPPAATPTFSPAAGTYTSVPSVTIADTTPGAAIYYTTDGSTPSVTSTQYTAAISVGVTETIQAIAIAPGYSASPVASAAYTINLPPPTFTITTSVSSLTIQPGQSGTVTISVTPQGGFAGATTFSCTGLPTGATCTFAPPSVTPSGGVATTTLTVSASSTASLQHDRTPFSGKLPGATLALALCCIGWRKRRSAKLLLLAFIVVSFSATLFLGCGGSSKPKPVTSTVSVVATSGAVQQTVPLTITIE